MSAPRANQTLLIRPKFRGLRLLATIPVTCFPPGTPANGCRDNQGLVQEIVLTSLALRIKAESRRVRRVRRNLFTTPRTCPSGGWIFEADIKYADGTSVNIPTNSPCSR